MLQPLDRLSETMDSLPSLPPVLLRLTEAIRDPNTSARQLASILLQDPALTARLLRLVNSPYYGFPRRIATVTDALTLLGFRPVQHLLLTAERKFWRCVESGEPHRLFGVEPPRRRIEAVRIVDMSSSNSWAEFAAVFRSTRSAFLEHEKAKVELKGLMPEDAKEAFGHGIRAKRSKAGAVSLDLIHVEGGHAPVQ